MRAGGGALLPALRATSDAPFATCPPSIYPRRLQIWMYFFVPETRGKSLEEIEDMLRNGRIR